MRIACLSPSSLATPDTHFMTPREVLALCREREIQAVDLRFMDFPGSQKHFTIPVTTLTEESFEDGLGISGSSLQGWQAINESDILVVPQPETAFVDPYRAGTLAILANIRIRSPARTMPRIRAMLPEKQHTTCNRWGWPTRPGWDRG